MRTIRLTVLVLALVTFAAASEFRDEARHLTISVPDGYQTMPKTPPQLFAGWYKKGANDDDLWTLNLSELEGLLPEGGLPAAAIPRGMTAATIEWKHEQITCIRMTEKAGDLEYVNFQALLPATPRGLRVTMGALKSHEPELRALFDSVVGSVDAPVGHQGSGKVQGMLKLAGGLLMVVLSFAMVFWFRRNASAKS